MGEMAMGEMAMREMAIRHNASRYGRGKLTRRLIFCAQAPALGYNVEHSSQLPVS